MISTNVPPIGAEPLTANVNVLVEVAALGVNDAVTPAGSALALRMTVWLKLLAGLMVIVLVSLLPRGIVNVVGEAVSVKLGFGMISLTQVF